MEDVIGTGLQKIFDYGGTFIAMVFIIWALWSERKKAEEDRAKHDERIDRLQEKHADDIKEITEMARKAIVDNTSVMTTLVDRIGNGNRSH